MKKCDNHANGKPCVQVIADGNCLKNECTLFPKVLRVIPKLKNMYELQAKGVILHTIWRFDEKQEKERLKKKEKAEKWLTELYPRIEENLKLFG